MGVAWQIQIDVGKYVAKVKEAINHANQRNYYSNQGREDPGKLGGPPSTYLLYVVQR
jgi:hypothetical protein